MIRGRGGFAASTPWATMAGDRRDRVEGGFTLIELVIVMVILPMVAGAIALALIAVFSLQSSVTSRLSDSADAQVVSANFVKDVQSAAELTTDSTLSPCGSSSQLLGITWGNGTEVSYADVQVGTGTSTVYKLYRYVCQGGVTATPTNTSVISNDIPSPSALQTGTAPVSVACNSTLTVALAGGSASGTTLNVSALPAAVLSGDKIVVGSGGTTQTYTTTAASPANGASLTVTSQTASGFPIGSQVYDNGWTTTNCGAASGWISAAYVTGVTLSITEPGSKYPYTLVALPGASAPPSQLTTLAATPTTSCGFATPGTGTYVSTLCFVDFSPYIPAQAAAPGCQVMTAGVVNTPYTMKFCLSVSGGPILATAFPTYFLPPTSEAFLGNNGFYTGVPGNPALYQQTETTTSTLTFTNIQVLDSDGNPATGWELVAGDAESTDAGESITWTANQPLNLLPNSPLSSIGNACGEPTVLNPLAISLTGVGTDSVECSSTVPTDKTGTVMLDSVTPSTLTVVLVGAGKQAMFLGLLLPS
jgi:prepilin-type N-terminal cleavage/methylation domain-containing protein